MILLDFQSEYWWKLDQLGSLFVQISEYKLFVMQVCSIFSSWNADLLNYFLEFANIMQLNFGSNLVQTRTSGGEYLILAHCS